MAAAGASTMLAVARGQRGRAPARAARGRSRARSRGPTWPCRPAGRAGATCRWWRRRRASCTRRRRAACRRDGRGRRRARACAPARRRPRASRPCPRRRGSASAASWPPGSCRAACAAARRGPATCPCATGARRVPEMRTSTPGSAATSVVERADVVAVCVRQRDAHDRRAELLGGARGATFALRGTQRVDEREPVVLGDQVGVDEAEPGETCHISGHRRNTNST